MTAAVPGKTSRCVGCGVVLPEIKGPVHEYVESSPACWAVYSEVLAREYSDRELFAQVHRLSVDAYAVQHPGRPSPRSIQSVAVHLMGLCAVLERGATHAWARKVIAEGASLKGSFRWLEPPPSRGLVTVVQVWETKDLIEHADQVRNWAESAWGAWSGHHARVRQWLDSLGSPSA